MGSAQANHSDQWDTLKMKAQAADSAAELEQLFGSKDEIGCTMEAI
jgi:hypothetical protein